MRRAAPPPLCTSLKIMRSTHSRLGTRRIGGAARCAPMLLLVSCWIPGQTTADSSPGEGSPAITRPSNALTRVELSTTSELTALEAVQRLRPSWLRQRGHVSVASPQGVGLVVDGNPRGQVENLAEILAIDVEEMHYLNSREATTRFGTGYPHGVVAVTTRAGRGTRSPAVGPAG